MSLPNHQSSALQESSSKRSWKSYAVLLAIVGGFTLNVATLVSSAVHDALYAGLTALLGSASQDLADTLLARSTVNVTRQAFIKQTKDLRAERDLLVLRNRRLESEVQDLTVKHRNAVAKIEKTAHSTKIAATSVKKRLTRVVTRNLAAVPAESVPYLGIASTIAVTSLDLFDACETLKDINRLLKDSDLPEESTEICGQKVPSKDEVLSSIKSSWRSSVAVISQQTSEHSSREGVVRPETDLPPLPRLKQFACKFISIPGFCADATD